MSQPRPRLVAPPISRFAHAVRAVQAARGMTGSDLATRCGITARYLSDLRHCRWGPVPQAKMAAKLFEAMGVPTKILPVYTERGGVWDRDLVGDAGMWREAIDDVVNAEDRLRVVCAMYPVE